MQPTDKTQTLATEILHHADFLLESSLTNEQRERLQQIRHAAISLISTRESHAETPNTTPAESMANNNKTNHILLVEDNLFTQKLITRLLSLQGYQVTLAQNGQEALNLLTQSTFDLTLMDLRMPVMDGFEATLAIRRLEEKLHKPRMPMIAVSAMIEEEHQKRAMDVGLDGFHAKPVRATTLFAEMEQLLNQTTTPPPNQPIAIPPPTTPPVVVVDMTRILHTVDGDMNLLQEIIDLYFTDAPRQLARIQQAIIEGQAKEVREAAHSLKGATGAFGRIEVYHLALALEEAGRDGNLALSEKLLQQIKVAIQTMETAIREFMIEKIGESS